MVLRYEETKINSMLHFQFIWNLGGLGILALHYLCLYREIQSFTYGIFGAFLNKTEFYYHNFKFLGYDKAYQDPALPHVHDVCHAYRVFAHLTP